MKTALPRKAHRDLLRAGWTAKRTGAGHVRYFPPPDTTGLHAVTVPSTPSDYRGVRNALATFKRQGIELLHR